MRILLFSILFLQMITLCAQQDSTNYIYQSTDYSFEVRAADLLSHLTAEEKISLLQHTSPEIPRLGIKPYNWWNEALHGVARAGTATVFPQAIALAATFDVNAVFKTFSAVSDEARAKYHDAVKKEIYESNYGITFWTPNINIVRDPRWGRAMETYGEDPFLTARIAEACINGLQGNDSIYYKTHACAKHFAVHSGPEKIRHSFDATVSSRDLWETYLPAFEYVVKYADVQEVMCAYNRLDGQPCCANNKLLTTILREKWNYENIVVTDCWAINDFYEDDTVIIRHRTHDSAFYAYADAYNSEVDLECGSGLPSLQQAFDAGLIPEDVIDKHVYRLLSARFKLGMFDPDSIVGFANIPMSVVDCEQHHKLALEMAQKSIVLLKNDNEILPLSKDICKLAVLGPNADDSVMQWGNYNGFPSKTVTILEGVSNKIGKDKIFYDKTCELVGDNCLLSSEIAEALKDIDTVIFVGGLSPQLEGEQLSVECAGFADGDRTIIELPEIQTKILKQLKALGKHVIFVICSGSSVAVPLENECIDAIIEAWYPGQAGGTAVADVIFGNYNPAGRLPVTFYASTAQLPDFEDYNMNGRTYKYLKDKPLYPFGFGLGYSSFDYDYVENSLIELQDTIALSVKISNIGKMSGEDVIQVYAKNHIDTKAPLKRLVCFKRVFIEAGESKIVELKIPKSGFYSYDDDKEEFLLVPGNYKLFYGGSSDAEKSIQVFIVN
jgi:beta-glucosidase